MRNKLMDIPEEGEYASLLYFGYKKPCNNPVQCRDFVCNNFF